MKSRQLLSVVLSLVMVFGVSAGAYSYSKGNATGGSDEAARFKEN